MKKTNLLALIAVCSLVLLGGCKKYEEGPSLSLKSKKARVANEWKVDYAFDYVDNIDVLQDYVGETWTFEKDGEWTERDFGVIDKSGTWEFVSDKESLLIKKADAKLDYYDILKLKEKEMWLKDQNEELHLVPK